MAAYNGGGVPTPPFARPKKKEETKFMAFNKVCILWALNKDSFLKKFFM